MSKKAYNLSINAPVCGCNRKTYDSECSANAEGVNVEYDGECEHGNACSIDNPCINTDRFYCKFELGSCGIDDNGDKVEGVCKAVCNDCACAGSWQPVCGCDGKVYSNDCVASIRGKNVMCFVRLSGDDCSQDDCNDGSIPPVAVAE